MLPSCSAIPPLHSVGFPSAVSMAPYSGGTLLSRTPPAVPFLPTPMGGTARFPASSPSKGSTPSSSGPLTLPAELREQVLQFLPLHALLALAQCSRYTAALAADPAVWRDCWQDLTHDVPPLYFKQWRALLTYAAVCPVMPHPVIQLLVLRSIPGACKPTLNIAMVGDVVHKVCLEPTWGGGQMARMLHRMRGNKRLRSRKSRTVGAARW